MLVAMGPSLDMLWVPGDMHRCSPYRKTQVFPVDSPWHLRLEVGAQGEQWLPSSLLSEESSLFSESR